MTFRQPYRLGRSTLRLPAGLAGGTGMPQVRPGLDLLPDLQPTPRPRDTLSLGGGHRGATWRGGRRRGAHHEIRPAAARRYVPGSELNASAGDRITRVCG